jgi:hypothetical protein
VAVEKWTAGNLQGLSWGNAFTASTLNTLASGNAILSDLTLDNSTTLDMFADFSVALGSITVAAPNYLGVYLAPLNQDGSTFGDGRFASAAAGPPSTTYYVGSIAVPTGAAANEGMVRGIILPPGQFKFLVYNQLGAALVGSGGNVAKYRSYNRQVT